ncbi:precorrin-2 dehydrogenase/sirohydrochlorin ferrochelatase family protein [Halorhabdus amylolytica]|uniref:precorrin-2 dehydrogenase/sirohydrochlorin ferrochelatase family protein n=1 Tax=Halorhabdus amylolytica TaxID=2559573 RepID=UPI0010A9D69D|nr:bifunctional precorrin-2 dehydrogenase/sirohydrochlorin ferrochelatase [Halorhabdus amylolytica]
MIPLFHDFRNERVVIFGGGSVGARKARRFAREADVTVISPEFADTKFGGADVVRARPGPEAVEDWLDRVDPVLVVAATDDEGLNDAIESAARDREILINRADESGERDAGSVVVPATIRRDPVTIAIATGATSPALSRVLREHLEDDPRVDSAGAMAELSSELRTELRDRGIDPATRREVLRDVVKTEGVWKALDTSGSNPRERAVSVISDVIGDTA